MKNYCAKTQHFGIQTTVIGLLQKEHKKLRNHELSSFVWSVGTTLGSQYTVLRIRIRIILGRWIWVWIRIRVKSRNRIRIKIKCKIRIRLTVKNQELWKLSQNGAMEGRRRSQVDL
jgi:hypothetical protein